MEDVATLRVRAEFLVGRVKSPTDVGDLLARQVASRQRIAAQLESRGDDSLVGVLVRLARSEQVADEPAARGAEGDLGDHRGSPKLDPSRLWVSATSVVARRTSSRATAKVAGSAWLVFAHLANWFTLLAMLVNTSRARCASACARRRSADWVAEPDIAASK